MKDWTHDCIIMWLEPELYRCVILLSNFTVCFCYKACTPIEGKVNFRCFWWSVGVKIKFLVKYAHGQTLNLGTLLLRAHSYNKHMS